MASHATDVFFIFKEPVVDWFKIKLQMLQYQKLRKVILEHYLLKVMYLCMLLKCLVLCSKGFDATLSRIKFGSLLTAKPSQSPLQRHH